MTEQTAISDDLAAQFATITGPRHAFSDDESMAPYLVERRNLYKGAARMVLRPGSTDEVSQILKLANNTGTSIIPQGGNTGLVGAQVPFDADRHVVVSLGRMNRIIDVNADANTLVCEAGTILANIQDAADEAGRLFPLSLGAEGTCQIGGNLSTNAGGTGVLAYGNARDMVLGLEVVLANGDILGGLRTLRKDNTGYDLKQLFLGAEGTLGIITAAALKLFARPKSREVAFVGLPDAKSAVTLFHKVMDCEGRNLTGFELMPRIGLDFVLTHAPGSRDPLAERHPWYVLVEISSSDEAELLKDRVENLLGSVIEDGVVSDVALAMSGQQADDFWNLRTSMSEVQKLEGGSIKHDISVPVSDIPAFLARAEKAVETCIPGARPVPFGHLGDGNLHYNVSQPIDADKAVFLSRWGDMNEVVHEIVASFGGSISAEHGIGVMKRDLLPRYKSTIEMELMRTLKKALDPNNILNPGKML
ncbi:MAG: FAD-binding oxidoreductase [Rhizobiales bacterium]|nr:FAD-binding oxidoreductase [Hyphomicrobiales bacterium]